MRTAFLFPVLLACATLPAAAQEKTKPNTLTPKEIADGWISMFDGSSLFGWYEPRVDAAPLQVALDGPKLYVRNGAVIVDHNQTLGFPWRYPNFELHADYRTTGRSLKPADFAIHYCNGFDLDVGNELPGGRAGRWGRITVRRADDSIFFCDASVGRRMGFRGRPGYLPQRTISFSNFADDAYAELIVRNIKLRPLAMKPLFNGKDLTGWNVFPGKKSQFTVEDGAIVCKNGPGDLQTESKYSDFILQLECKCNGNHVNSGVIFRCKPNEYQNGYEAQVHNNFTARPPKEYRVEQYGLDELGTRDLVDPRIVKSAAVDYGTGAIYGRIPARTAAAKDGEWFTMTIVADGESIATWVNGIQQVDWYDARPRSDNPRTGCRLEAGHISLEGHDPTTDVSFRNIRIAELPSPQ